MWRRHIASAVALLACLTACGVGGSRSGGPQAPVELVMINYDSGDGLVTAPSEAWFVDRVSELSGGRLTVRVEKGAWATHGEEVLAVAGSEADLGWVGSRVLDLLGVRELQPLHAPLLIDGYALQAAVLTDPATTTALSAMRRLGVEPLALLGDGMRFPASNTAPLLEPQDWRGTRIWMLESEIQRAGLATLGATAVYGGDAREMVQVGAVAGLETMWRYFTPGATYIPAPFVVPNVVLSPRTTVLFANPRSLENLDPQQRQWVRQAATDAVTWSVEHAGDDVDPAIAGACRYGARIAVASPDQLAALRATVEPVHAALRADPTTTALITSIEGLKARTPPDPPPTVPTLCRYQPGEDVVSARRPELHGPGLSATFPTGTYRYMLTPADVQNTGNADSMLHGSRPGIYTWSMIDGQWRATVTPSEPGITPRDCGGWYAVRGNTVTFSTNPTLDWEDPHCLPPSWTVGWSADAEGLHWKPPSLPILAPLFTMRPWERID